MTGRAPAGARVVHAVLPGDVGDDRAPSGGNRYDLRVCRDLPALGWQVHRHQVPGGWPQPDTTATTALARLLAGLPDGAVVLLDGLVACGVPDVLRPEAARLRLAVLVHLPLADETGLAPATAAELDARERRTLHAVHAVIATSDWAARRIRSHHGPGLPPVTVARPGVDPAPLAPGTDGAGGLLCVASVTPRKGHRRLVDALATVTDAPWTCAFVGSTRQDPNTAQQLRARIAQLGLAGRIACTGPRTGAALAAHYAAADLVLLASYAETYGMVLTEALARGVPVVATAVAGVPEAVGRAPDGSVPGLLVPPGERGALAAALRAWFDDRALRRRLAVSARGRRAMLEGWEMTSHSLAGALERLRNAPRSP
ncbi:glycosyltransferase family 4 protein [Streptomyces noursei]|uniref:glycosyltransferase family 4 protein n=1 Tax=Streptomyces noursei TaxID=1971 RepID=UPI0005CAC80A|nr:glycosyltransferase family 4 protein [Streptomyces noursei]